LSTINQCVNQARSRWTACRSLDQVIAVVRQGFDAAVFFGIAGQGFNLWLNGNSAMNCFDGWTTRSKQLLGQKRHR
jgi:uncharacterized sodium:solute symporter family permease YidK